jgi:23S rRNA pseudouridine2605 synthase
MGYCSRSQAAALIRAGRVTLNRRLTRDPKKPVRMGLDHIAVDDAQVEEGPKIYLMMNKPRGVVTTASDEKGRASVYDLLEPDGPWVGSVGRLDKASEGLLLFTSDSKWAAKIAAPESHLEKRYHVQMSCVAGDSLVARIRAGVTVGGEHLGVKAARVVRLGGKNSWLEISLDEGKNRQIRRLLEALGVEVLRLVRVSIGPIALGNLKKGEVRPLTDGEKKLVDDVLHGKQRI